MRVAGRIHLIIRNEHEKSLHAGTQAVLANLRYKYWIINGKNAVKKILRRCVICFRVKPSDNLQPMGNLPEARLKPTRPFTISGYSSYSSIFGHDGQQNICISTLQGRSKWMFQHPQQIGVNTLVLLKDSNAPPLQWKLGRIVAVHPGSSDGVVRVVSVKTPNDSVLKKSCAHSLHFSYRN
ncbi:hypothetical protein NQ318_018033 [Aromia moschata]|uniref:Integrase zinc-binding domain-containing protein n=1 Tax=Aromia moschata TaxID=1265417 RepID=A0AAV8ZCM9_9CUCU|nr:hypothetical protein NQ318_018033 [Aromia moschata]